MDNIEAVNAKAQAAKSQPQGGAAATGSSLKADQIFGMMRVFLERGEGKHLIPKVGAIFGFEITKKKGGKPEKTFEINLKEGSGYVKTSAPAKADATFTMTDDDFEAVCLGKLNPQMAFMKGQMKIKGNMGKANKFTPELFPPPTPENIAKYAGAKL